MTDFKDFIGIFDNVIPPDVCFNIIEHYNRVQSSNLTYTRQQQNSEVTKMQKDTDTYFLTGTSAMFNEKNVDNIILNNDSWIFNQFKQSLWTCYQEYANKYGVLDTVAKHSISGTVKIQKTLPAQGYHVWHCEHDNIRFGNRLILALLYLNDVEEGGETEFLYQSIRVKPKQGTMILCPAGFTHTHRGNPPLSGEKYIMNTWIEFIE